MIYNIHIYSRMLLNVHILKKNLVKIVGKIERKRMKKEEENRRNFITLYWYLEVLKKGY